MRKKTPYFFSTISELMQMDGQGTTTASSVLGPRHPLGSISIFGVRRVIEAFKKPGHSSHSSNRSSLGFVIAYCEENGIPYTLKAAFTADGKPAGYYIKRDVPLA